VLEIWKGESAANGGNVWWYDYLDDFTVAHLQDAACNAYNVIEKIEFIRNIEI
jgi:hypothetical protein